MVVVIVVDRSARGRGQWNVITAVAMVVVIAAGPLLPVIGRLLREHSLGLCPVLRQVNAVWWNGAMMVLEEHQGWR